jgi:hypothetical protein
LLVKLMIVSMLLFGKVSVPFPENVMLMCAWFIGISLRILARSWKTGCGDSSIPDDVSVVLPIIVVVVVVVGVVAAVCASTAASGSVDTAIRANMPIIIIIGVLLVSVLIVIVIIIITVSYYRHTTNCIWVYDDDAIYCH